MTAGLSMLAAAPVVGPGLRRVGKGLRLYHGSPLTQLRELLPSERGPLGPGVYVTPAENYAARYAGDAGKVYGVDVDPAELFHGIRSRDSSVNNYEVWRQQGAKLLAAAPEGSKSEIANLLERMDPSDGYPFYARLKQIMGADAEAQGLMKRAGFKGMSGTVDGPEVVLFDPLRLSQGIRAFHGSPHDFDKFDLSKIGTGEGAQAYGHGLYFADSEDVAKFYRDSVSNRAGPTFALGDREMTEDYAANWLAQNMGFYGLPTSFAGRRIMNDIANGRSFDEIRKSSPEKWHPAINWLEENNFRLARGIPEGRMYEVRINADPEQFLDWDKPLKDQAVHDLVAAKVPADMREAFEKNVAAGIEGGNVYRNYLPSVRYSVRGSDGKWAASGAATLDDALKQVGGDRSKVMVVHNPGADTAATVLREAGIPGIRYLDQGSRSISDQVREAQAAVDYWKKVGDPDKLAKAESALANTLRMDEKASRNYVVFDDKLIDIIRKYGLLAPFAAGAVAPSIFPPPEEN